MAPIKEESAPTDLFDQVKRNLEVKDGQESSPTTAKQNKATKAASATTTPSSAATPKRAARTPKTSKSPTTTKSPSAESKPVLVNPKKKWLKSSMQSKAEANPEVKIKLMADWSEEEEEAHQPQRPSEAAVKEAHENGSDQELTNSKVLQQRSDDEDSGKEMDTDDNGNPVNLDVKINNNRIVTKLPLLHRTKTAPSPAQLPRRRRWRALAPRLTS